MEISTPTAQAVNLVRSLELMDISTVEGRAQAVKTVVQVTQMATQLRRGGHKAESGEVVPYAEELVTKLNSRQNYVMYAALQLLNTFDPADLALYAQQVAQKVIEEDVSVSKMARRTLGNLKGAALVPCAEELREMLKSSKTDVRVFAINTCGKLEETVLVRYVEDLIDLLNDANESVQEAVESTLDKLNSAALATVKDELMNELTNSNEYVQYMATRMLGKLHSVDLETLVEKLADMLKPNIDAKVRRCAVTLLGKLDPVALQTHAGMLASVLNDDDRIVRTKAMQQMENISYKALVVHSSSIADRIRDDKNALVRTYALKALKKLDATTLAPYVGAVVSQLETESEAECVAALETLGKLEGAELAKQASHLLKLYKPDKRVRVQNALARTLGKLVATILKLKAYATLDGEWPLSTWVLQNEAILNAKAFAALYQNASNRENLSSVMSKVEEALKKLA